MVFAAVSTWARLGRERGWLRPRLRLYPALLDTTG